MRVKRLQGDSKNFRELQYSLREFYGDPTGVFQGVQACVESISRRFNAFREAGRGFGEDFKNL